MRILNYYILAILITLFTVSSCGVEKFAANKNVDTTSVAPKSTNQVFQCAQFTLVRPPVDLLFLWDNSSSSIFINDETKAALNNTINLVSDRFDYHIMMAPLIGSGNANTFFITRPENTFNPGSGITKIASSQAATKLSEFPTVSHNSENGLERVRSLIANNITNGVFRSNAYQIIVVMSNEDDNSYITGSFDNPVERENYLQEKKEELLCLRGNYAGSCTGQQLDSLMMRFLSIVAHNESLCQSNPTISQFKVNYLYKKMSELLYSAPYTNGIASPTDQTSTPIDSRDICQGNYNKIFDGVNSVIQDTLIQHTYKYWPVAAPGTSVDPNTITVFMSNGQQFFEIPSSVTIVEDNSGKNDTDNLGNPVSGWRYAGEMTQQDTRFLPTEGEPYTGHLIQLFGDAKVSYPFCLQVTSQAQAKYYGYIHMSSKPIESSIQVKINGVVIPQNATNGWQLIKAGSEPQFISNQNIQITSPSDRTPVSPGQTLSGYFVEVFGTAVYTDGASIEIQYDPAGI